MLRNRIVPTLQLHDGALVKSYCFNRFKYIGDPINTVKIFNELEVDEICIMDISLAKSRNAPDLKLLKDIASECFMPLSYGGGITKLMHASSLFECGYEKVVINTANYDDPTLITQIASVYGTQSIIASIDVNTNWRGQRLLYSKGGSEKINSEIIEYAKRLEESGAGEILLTSMNREGTYNGYDLKLIQKVSNVLTIPVIAHGGAGQINHLISAIHAGASAVAVGSMFVFQKKDMGVLVNYLTQEEQSHFVNACRTTINP